QNNALEKQASTFQRTIENQRQAQQAQIDNLERVLNNKNTTSNAGDISSAAENSIRQAVARQYEDLFQAEVERNQHAREHQQDSFNRKFADSKQDSGAEMSKLHRQNQLEQASLRNTFVQHVNDVEENKRQTVDRANE